MLGRWRQQGRDAAAAIQREDVNAEAPNREAEQKAQEDRRRQAEEAFRRAGGLDVRSNLTLPSVVSSEEKKKQLQREEEEARKEKQKAAVDKFRQTLRDDANNFGRQKSGNSGFALGDGRRGTYDRPHDSHQARLFELPTITPQQWREQQQMRQPRPPLPPAAPTSSVSLPALANNKAEKADTPRSEGSARSSSTRKPKHLRSLRQYWQQQKREYGMDQGGLTKDKFSIGGEPGLDDLGPPLPKDTTRGFRRSVVG
eukprot:TRINITY_DN8320_c0_g1_i1.p1 TRINITY_DN8320_c0_g1~~TRINITY_DN8320_c0_g1_i1.p1  ORF type:complete len:256 (-),score=66.80 TRINITY_DN8320_c0_g1_i1:356-1123(-)